MNYKLSKDIQGNIQTVIKTVDGVNYFIPFDSENTMYKEYLEWVAEGNTAEAAE